MAGTANSGNDYPWPFCDNCGKKVSTAEGAVSISTREAEAAKEERQTWQEAHAGQAMNVQESLTMPATAKWMWGHRQCSPNNHDYGFEAARFVSLGQALARTLHLMEKWWLADTDWTDFVRRVHKVPF